jgi:hypothetical protein
MAHLLSKSSFVKGLQCVKQLYLYKHFYNLRDEVSEAQQAVFDKGTDVGVLAQKLFPCGIDVAPEVAYKYEGSIKKTQECIANGTNVIYEATFLYDDVLILADIFVRDGDGWKLYEVKSSTEVNDVHINDAAIQYYVITNLEIKLKDISIIYINNEYVRKGDLDINQLFTIQSVKDEVLELQNEVSQKVNEFKKLLSEKYIPDIDIGPQCNDPYQCSFYNYCRKDLPEYSVFNISRLRAEKKYELYYKGLIKIEDIPQSYLNDKQKVEVECYLNGKERKDIKAIRHFLSMIVYPVAYMDFETIQPVVPLFENTHPYQQIVFQYSVHFAKNEKVEVIHKEYLAKSDIKIDPRIDLIKNLIKDLDGAKTIIVYNQGFETGRLNEMARDFPQFESQIQNIISKVVDLMKPFQNKSYYKKEMQGSYSIKAVLPACIPEMSYDELEIKEGGSASHEFENLYYETDFQKIETTRNSLLKYCEMDSYAMLKLQKFLEGLT